MRHGMTSTHNEAAIAHLGNARIKCIRLILTKAVNLLKRPSNSMLNMSVNAYA